MQTQTLSDENVRAVRQRHDAYKTQVAIAEAKQKEISQTLMTEYGLTLENAQAYIEQQTQQLQAVEAQVGQQLHYLNQQLVAALAQTQA